jgi:uncharacterized membrane protein
MSTLGMVLVLRLLHILTGVFWVGGILVFARFIFPTARALGSAAGPFMDQVVRVRKLPRALILAGVFSVLSGVGLYWRDSMGFESEWMASPTGIVFGIGGLLAITALVIGVSVNAPTAQRLAALSGKIQAQGSPPTPEQQTEVQRLQKRLGVVLPLVTALLALATVAMALARYVT